MTHIVVIEDDQTVCDMLQLFLSKEGYEVTFFHNGSLSVEQLLANHPALLIIDWMLPGKDGLTILKEIRQKSGVPIIMLTAKDGDVDQVMGLENGADDYVTKPFSPFTLLARIKAVLRRTQSHLSQEQEAKPGKRDHLIEGRNYRIHLDTHEVVLSGKPIEGLTPKEFDLLVCMARSPRHVFSREQLIERVWGIDFLGDERTIDAHIKRLRKKIHTPPYSWIHTVWGIGYKFDGELRDEE